MNLRAASVLLVETTRPVRTVLEIRLIAGDAPTALVAAPELQSRIAADELEVERELEIGDLAGGCLDGSGEVAGGGEILDLDGEVGQVFGVKLEGVADGFLDFETEIESFFPDGLFIIDEVFERFARNCSTLCCDELIEALCGLLRKPCLRHAEKRQAFLAGTGPQAGKGARERLRSRARHNVPQAPRPESCRRGERGRRAWT